MNPLYLSVFLLTSSVLIFEISLTRLFSIYLSYHFAFMVVSIAMLGIGSAGTFLSLRTGRAEALKEALPLYPFLTGISITMSYIISNRIPFDPVRLSWDRMQLLYLFLYCSIFSIPFFFSGGMIATAFYTMSRYAQRIYASDLIGAGAGSLLVILLLNNAGPEYAIVAASAISLISSIIIGSARLRGLCLIIILINSLLLILHPEFIETRISPYKNLSVALRYPGSEHIGTYNHSIARIDILRSPMIRFAPGLSLQYTNPLPEQIGIAVDGGEIYTVTTVNNEEALKFLDLLPSAIPYKLRKAERALIIDPKGGLPVLMARRNGVREIHKVESNPLVIRVIRDELGDLSGGIFSHNTWQGLGRNLIRRMEGALYDIIDISMTGTTVSDIFGIMEDYGYTVEAFAEYLRGLKEDGILSITMYIIPPPRREFRVLATAITALEEAGAEEPWRNIVAIRSWDTMTIMIKKTPFSDVEIRRTEEFIKGRGFDFVYYPGIREEETGVYIKGSKEYFKGFISIINPDERGRFINDYLFDIRPVYDENPFFHYYLKIKNIRKIYELMGRRWLYFIEEGYLTPLLLIITTLLSTCMILLPVILKTRPGRFRSPDLLPLLLYFSMLGLGFMFIEVTLIQKHILILENPVYSLSIVLTTILISSGAGSILSSRFRSLQRPVTILLLSCVVFIYSLAQAMLFRVVTPLPLSVKIPVILIGIVPIGVLMGIPLPMGIRLMGDRRPSLIPLAWATNAFLSVIAPVITIMIAITIGFKGILWLASGAYIIAWVSLKRL